MATTILPAYQNRWAQVGTGLGQGIGATLGELAQHKLDQMAYGAKKERTKKDLTPLLGEEMAEIVAGLPEKSQEKVLMNLHLLQGDKEGNSGSGNGIDNIEDIGKQQLPPMKAEQVLEGLAAPGSMNAITGGKAQSIEELLAQHIAGQQTNKNAPGQMNAPEQPKVPGQQKTSNQLTPQQRVARALASSTGNTAADQRERHFQANQESKNKAQVFQIIKPQLDKLASRAEAARKNIRSNERILAAITGGKVRAGTKQAFMEKLGIGDWWMNTDTALVQKELARLAQGAASAFNTSRLTNLDVGLYQKSLGSLRNTTEALDVIVRNNILEERAVADREDAFKEIMDKNGWKEVPGDILAQIDRLVEPKLKQYAEEAMRNVEEAVAKQAGVQTKRFESVNDAPKPEGWTLTNEKTGESLIVKNGQWEKVK